MIFWDIGEVIEGLYVLGTNGIPSYLLDGPKPVLFDAGITCIGGVYANEARKVLGDREPHTLFLTHAHFDHLGSVSVLKKAFSGLEVAASKDSVEILKKPKAIELIGFLNEQARIMVKTQVEIMGTMDDVLDDPFEPFEVDLVLSDGQKIDMGGGLTLEVIATPGHTRDFLSYYIPERKILVASEAVGCSDTTGHIYVEFLTDYDAYLDSQERLSKLDVEVLCQGHYCVHLGQDAKDFFGRSIEATKKYKSWIEELLEAEDGDVDKVVAIVKAEEYDSKPEPKQPEIAYMINTQTRVKLLKKRLA